MNFRFNFSIDTCSEVECKSDSPPSSPSTTPVITFTFAEFLKTRDSSLHHTNDVLVLANDWKINCVVVPPEKDFAKITDKSDVVPGLYEGGLKVWECALDLAGYLLSAQVDIKDKVVFEIGCGAGVPGVVAAKHNPRSLFFQDFNEFVLRCCTAQTLLSNLNDDDEINADNVRFIAGDWSGVQIDEKADVILTSETIYERRNFAKLYRLIDRSLSPGGVVYLASKAFYFGVGGGVDEWNRFVANKGKFDVRLLWRVGCPVRREVWAMTHANSSPVMQR